MSKKDEYLEYVCSLEERKQLSDSFTEINEINEELALFACGHWVDCPCEVCNG